MYWLGDGVAVHAGLDMIRVLSAFFLLSLSFLSSASELIFWSPSWDSSKSYSHPFYACRNGSTAQAQWVVYNNGTVQPHDGTSSPAGCHRKGASDYQYYYIGSVNKGTKNCPYGDNGSTCNLTCDSPNMIVDGQCVSPPPDVCAAKAGQTSSFKQSGNSSDADAYYKPVAGSKFFANPRHVVGDGCAMLVNGGTRCKVYGDGEYTCVGTATYTGDTASASLDNLGPPSDVCEGASCPDTTPLPTSTASNQCTNWQEDAEGRRTRQCTTSSTASKPGQAACLTDGSLVCVSAVPPPESDSKTRDDDVKESPNSSGGKTTDTTSTTTKTYCLAGACTTSTTNNTNTTVTNGAGQTTSDTSTCDGDDCAGPETKEEENDEPPAQSELPSIGGDDDPGYSESLTSFNSRVSASPLVAGVSSIAFPSGGGSCNMGSASVFGGSISFNSFCTMAPDVLGGLRFLFLSIWAIAAVRLFMTA